MSNVKRVISVRGAPWENRPPDIIQVATKQDQFEEFFIHARAETRLLVKSRVIKLSVDFMDSWNVEMPLQQDQSVMVV